MEANNAAMTKVKKHSEKPSPQHFEYGLQTPLPVMEHFYTLQGEGSWAGTPAYFIRLAGCDVGCHWCDVKDSWEVAANQKMEINSIINQVSDSQARRVVITGGEPTIYDLSLLISELQQIGVKVHLETAGVHALKGKPDWVCFSPKKFMQPLEEFYSLAHELKVIVYNHHDLKWAESHMAKCDAHVQGFLQVEWGRREIMTEPLIEYIKAHPHWKLSVQTHKYLDIP